MFQKIKNVYKHVGAGRNVNFYTLARNALPVYFSKSGYALSPLTIFISINSDCNLRCKMCDVGQKNNESSFYKNLKPGEKGESLKFERLTELIKEARKFSPRPRISVTTTEPFLYDRLFDFARLVSENDMEFQVTTNGSLLHKFDDEIFSSKIDELGISLDGKEGLHDDIRGVKGLYDNIVRSLKYIRDRKNKEGLKYPKVTLATVITNFNYGNLIDLADGLESDCYDRLIISYMNFINEDMAREHNKDFGFIGEAKVAGLPGQTDNYKVDVNELNKQVKYIRNHFPKVCFAPDYNEQQLRTFFEKPSDFVWNNRCYIPWFVMEILANGDVIPLTRCINITMGNIYGSSLAEIWNGKKFRDFRMQLQKYKRFPVCRRCRGIL